MIHVHINCQAPGRLWMMLWKSTETYYSRRVYESINAALPCSYADEWQWIRRATAENSSSNCLITNQVILAQWFPNFFCRPLPPPPPPHTLLTSEIVNPLGSSPTSTYSQVLRQIFVCPPLTTAFALRGQHPPELGTTVLATAFLKHRSPDDVAFLFCHKLCSMFRYAVSCTVLEWFKIL